MRSTQIMAISLICGISIAGCSKSKDDSSGGAPGPTATKVSPAPGVTTAKPGTTTVEKPSEGGTGNAALDVSIHCWSLTKNAYFQHMAMADQTGNLPKPPDTAHMNWAKHGALIAFNSGMKLKELEDAKNAASRANKIYSLTVDDEYAKAVQTCIDTTPAKSNEPDPSWPD